MSSEEKWDGIKFIWNIENFNYLNDKSLQSPSFSWHSMLWEVTMFNQIIEQSINLRLMLLTPVRHGVINYSFALLDSDGIPLIWEEETKAYPGTYIPMKILNSNKTKFLSNDILTVQCRIWLTPRGLVTPLSRFARTRIEPTVKLLRKTFTWTVDKVSSLRPLQSFERNETMDNGESFTINLVLNKKDKFEMTLTVSVFRIHAKVTIVVLDASGKKFEFANCEREFESKGEKWNINTNISKAMLMCYQSVFLPGDTLSLQFTCTFSGNVSFNSLVDESEVFVNFPRTTATASEISEAAVCADDSESNQPIEPGVSNTTSQALQDMYNEGFFSDFNLRIGDRTFPVHRALLGVRSHVFRAMFTTEMREKQDNCVDIQDVDGDTLQRLLRFVYLDRLEEDLGWENASSLYAAADKYALEPLKQGCSDILKSGFCVSNVLEILEMADMHQDQDLKYAALDFISLNDKEIVGSEFWSKFEKNNPLLVIDTFRNLYMKKMNG